MCPTMYVILIVTYCHVDLYVDMCGDKVEMRHMCRYIVYKLSTPIVYKCMVAYNISSVFLCQAFGLFFNFSVPVVTTYALPVPTIDMLAVFGLSNGLLTYCEFGCELVNKNGLYRRSEIIPSYEREIKYVFLQSWVKMSYS